MKEFILILSILCLGLLFILHLPRMMALFSRSGEGFYNDSERAAYESLRSKLNSTLGPYCQIADFVQEQAIQMYESSLITEPIPTPPPKPIAPTGSSSVDKKQGPKAWWGDSAPAKSNADTYSASPTPPLDASPPQSKSSALNSLSQTYRSVYDCTDELKLSRPYQCSPIIAIPNPDWQYVPCSTYRALPPYNADNTGPIVDALIKIPSNTPKKLVMEVAWYASVIKKLQEGIDAGANPPSSPPPAPGDDSGKTYSANPDENPPSAKGAAAGNDLVASLKRRPTISEGFFAGGQCSAEQMAARRRAMEAKRQAELANGSDSCTMPSIQSEIDRVNGILNNGEFLSAMSQCRSIYAAAMKLKSDLELLKAGNLYDWQKSGPSKSYKRFDIKGKGKGYDRFEALKASLMQNKDFNF